MDHKSKGFDFGTLVSAIFQAREHLAARAGHADCEGNLLHELSQVLPWQNMSRLGRRQLYNYLAFYCICPRIVGTVSPPKLASFRDILLLKLIPGEIRLADAGKKAAEVRHDI